VTFERRTAVERMEWRADGDKLVARGYAAVFGATFRLGPGVTETIAPGAFKKTLKEQDVVALANHDANLLLGRMSASTLRTWEDKRGLAYEIDMPNTTVGRDWAELLKRGDVVGSSFGFRVIREDFERNADGEVIRTLLEVSLRDVGPVTFPAYSATEAALRHVAEERSLDLNELVAAADAGCLADLILPRSADADEVTTADEADDESRSEPEATTPVVIRHLGRFIR
jgi:uncharacterized protein